MTARFFQTQKGVPPSLCLDLKTLHHFPRCSIIAIKAYKSLRCALFPVISSHIL